MSDKSSLERIGTVLWRVLAGILFVGILCALFAPDDYKKVKKFGFVLVYCAGLPLLLGSFVLYSEKKGWLK